MKKDTRQQIADFIQKKEQVTPKSIAKHFPIGPVMVHRHLNKLQESGVIAKSGSAPNVSYFFIKEGTESNIVKSLDILKERFLKKFNKKKTVFWDITKSKDINFTFLLKKSAFFSSKIEGNTLDLNSFMNPGVLQKQKSKEVKEINDLIAGYEFAKSHTLSHNNVLKVHKMISKRLVPLNRQGKYRQEPVGVFSNSGLEYMAIEPELVSAEMLSFFSEIQKLLDQKMTKSEVYFYSLWIHLMFVLIHPFSDGNGRMARLLEKWFLAEKLGDIYWYLESEKYYWDNREWYYESLKLGQNYWVTDFIKASKFLKR